MILVDANLLLYACHPGAEQHRAARAWIESVLSGSELVRFPWLALWAFLRIATHPRLFARPLSGSEAAQMVTAWLDAPVAGVLQPAERYWEILSGLMREAQATGPLVMDVAIAALAIEHGATLHTTDRDFTRFPGLKWRNPLQPG